LQGRSFDARDTASAPAVAIVSESLAREYWPGENPIGKQLKPKFNGGVWCGVVGVVADVRHWGADVEIEPTAYYPYTQIPDTIRPLLEANMGVAVRSNLRQDDLLHDVQAQVVSIDKNVPVYQVKTMDSMVSDAGSPRRFDLSLLGAFSLLALLLAALGVYAVMAYSVEQRTREIGIRIALGARAQNVQLLILAQGARFALIGSAIGVAGAFALHKVMATVVYGVSPNDPLTFLTVPVLMVSVVLTACYLPARRATRTDPIIALRSE
jgi:putative ABC transport system permease protein